MTLSRPDDFHTEELPLHDKGRGQDDSRRSKSAEHQLGSAEFSGALESSVPLEVPRGRYVAIANVIPNPTSSMPVDSGRLLAQPTSQPVAPAPLVDQPSKVVIPREKLIVQQVSPEYQQIAVVDVMHSPTVSSEFTSTNEVIQFLTVITAESNSGLQKVQIKVVLKDAKSAGNLPTLVKAVIN